MELKEGNCPKVTEGLATVPRSPVELQRFSASTNLTLLHYLHQNLESDPLKFHHCHIKLQNSGSILAHSRETEVL